MSRWCRVGGEERVHVISVRMEAFVVRRTWIRYRAWVARVRRVARSVLMVRGQYGREVLE